MQLPLVTWADSWFHNPSSLAFPTETSREWIFLALVAAICSGPKLPKDYRRIHDYFTYLLLGWNPVTAWEEPSCVEVPEDLAPGIFTDNFMSVAKALMDYEHPVTMSLRYQALHQFREATKMVTGYTEEYRGEQISLSIVMLWMLTRKPIRHPTDLITIRSCMDLYHRGRSKYPGTMRSVYTGEVAISYHGWLSRQIETLLIAEKDTESMFEDIVYLAMFACLVRADRMLLAFRDNRPEMYSSIHDLLVHEVNALTEQVESHRLIALEKIRPRKKSFLGVFGIRIKKKLREG